MLLRFDLRSWLRVDDGTVNLAGMADNCPAMADIRWHSAGTRHLIPETERAGSQEAVVSCPEQVAPDPEQILDDAVHRCEPLQMVGRLGDARDVAIDRSEQLQPGQRVVDIPVGVVKLRRQGQSRPMTS